MNLAFLHLYSIMNIKLEQRLLLVLFLSLLLIGFTSCKRGERKKIDTNNPIVRVNGMYLYADDIQKVIPPNVSQKDSIEIAESFIRKWVINILMYENAKKNITNKEEIDNLVEDYRKSLTIHQYQRLMIEQKVPKEPSDDDIKNFYENFGDQLKLKENIIKGLLLIIPNNAPKINDVRSWVRSSNEKSLEKLDKYSLQNAISYDYFGSNWIPFNEVLKKIPLTVENAGDFITSTKYYEIQDSTQYYLLRILDSKRIGQTEPLDLAKEQISQILLNKFKSNFVNAFENELYMDAVQNEKVIFYNK
jgi:hypothetical protein